MANYDSGAVDNAMEEVRDHYDNPVVGEVIDEIDIHHLIDRSEGRGGGLRSSKPRTDSDGPLEAYIWRMSRFHSGDDPSMPVMAASDLDAWLDENEVNASVFGTRSDEARENGEAVKEMIDEFVVTLVLLALGRNPNGGAKRWEGLLF